MLRSRRPAAKTKELRGRADAEIRAEGLGHAFRGGPLLFENVSFRFRRGDVVAICGPSGSGKSTLLSILAGWEKPVEGQIDKPGIRTTGWVFQNPHGVAHRTALDHVAFPLLAQGSSRRDASDRARDVLSGFGLENTAERPFHALSGGEAQRLMLARAVCIAPDLLLVDEPTAQLDQTTARTVNATLRHVADGGSIVLVATHDQGTRDACTYTVDLAAHPLTERTSVVSNLEGGKDESNSDPLRSGA